MKNLFKTMMLVAVAAMGFTACSNEAVEEVNPAVESKTYTMTFVADAPNTRTSVAITGDVATYSWSEEDKVGFYYVDTDATGKKKQISNKAQIADDGSATFTASFDAIEGATTYNIGAFYPGNSWVNSSHAKENPFNNVKVSISGAQTLTKDTFDPTADLMMAKPFMDVALENGSKTLEFTRIAAVGKMNLKLENMEDGEVIKSVRFALAEGTHFNGPVTLDFENSTYTLAEEGTNHAVTLTGKLPADADADGTAIFFTCFPGEYTGAYSIEVETDKATYSKTGILSDSKPLSFTAGNVLSFNATMDNRIENIEEAGTTVDVLNRALTGVSKGAGYSAWSNKTSVSSAVYAGQSAGGNGSADNDAIQLRSSNNNSGIVTTTSGGYAKKIKVTWDTGTANGRILNIYGKNTAYTAATDLYDNNKQGTLLGTIKMGTSTELEINGDYEYIGMRSSSSAMYIDEIEITWGPGDPREAQTLSFSAAAAEATVGEDFTEPTLTGAQTTVTYTSSNTAVATVNETTGEVTLVAAGTTTITASAAENETYKADSALYTLTVNPAQGGEEPDAGEKVTFELTATATSANNQLTWSQNGITIVQDKGKGSSAVNSSYNKVSTMRVYQGHTLTFSSEYNITNVEIVTNGKYFGPTATASVGTLTNPKTNGCTITWEGSSKNLVITNGTGSGGEQIRATKIVITYTK